MSAPSTPRSLRTTIAGLARSLAVTCLLVPSLGYAQPSSTPDPAGTSVSERLADPDAAPAGASSTTHLLGLSAYASNIAYDLGLTWQATFGPSWRLRVEARSGRIAYDTIGGFAVEDGNAHMLRVGPRAVLARSGPLALSLHADAVTRVLSADDDAGLADNRALVAGIDLGMVGDVRISDRWAAQIGFRVPFEMELDPVVTTHRVGPLTTLDLSWAVSDAARIAAWAVAGGQFGSDGDGLKMEAGGGLALRWYLGGHARTSWIY